MTTDFNLWDEPWIRVLRHDGQREALSIRETLVRAHDLRALHDPSPLTVVGIHRLLTAIVQWIYAPESLREIADVLNVGQLDAERIDAFGTQFRHRFGLFDPVAPFMQTADVPAEPGKEAKTIAYLLAEVPSGTNRSHFQHVTDDTHQLCAACCARAIVTIPAFASSGGAGIKPSINGVPPIYLLPVGLSLCDSLARSLTVADHQPQTADPFRPQEASWNGLTTVFKATEVTDVGYLESLTFPARRMRLYQQAVTSLCTRCGSASERMVRETLFEMGLSRPKNAEIWKDPFAAYRLASTKAIVSVKPQEGRALWREYSTLLLGEAEFRPHILQQLSRLVDDGRVDKSALLRFRCIGLRTDGKAKIFEWFDETLDLPPALLREEAGANFVREALERANTTIDQTRRAFTHAFRPQGSERAWFQTLADRMIASYWAQLALPFRELVASTGGRAAYEVLQSQWSDTILRSANQVAKEALAQVGDSADLLMRRVRAEDRISRTLRKYRKEWINE